MWRTTRGPAGICAGRDEASLPAGAQEEKSTGAPAGQRHARRAPWQTARRASEASRKALAPAFRAKAHQGQGEMTGGQGRDSRRHANPGVQIHRSELINLLTVPMTRSDTRAQALRATPARERPAHRRCIFRARRAPRSCPPGRAGGATKGGGLTGFRPASPVGANLFAKGLRSCPRTNPRELTGKSFVRKPERGSPRMFGRPDNVIFQLATKRIKIVIYQ